MNPHHQQFQAIQSMLAAGHRSVQLERHSLLLIGLVGGFIAGATEYLITAERFPDTTQRAVVLLAWLCVWLGCMALLDHRLTRRARERRDETLPFAQAQITRAWWMLLGMGSLGTFAMFFYGGGGMIYALWIVLATILIGVAGLAAGLPYGATHWLAASCFAIGMPLAGWLNARFGAAGLPRGLFALALWLVLVVTPPLLISRYSTTTAPPEAPVAVGGDLYGGEQVLRLPAGSRVPLRVDLESPILAIYPNASLEMTLNQPLEVALRDGTLDGRYRIGGGDWHAIREGVLRISIDRISPRLDDHATPEVRAHARLDGPASPGVQP